MNSASPRLFFDFTGLFPAFPALIERAELGSEKLVDGEARDVRPATEPLVVDLERDTHKPELRLPMIPVTVRIFAYTEPVDMRRGFDGLALIARDKLCQDPKSGVL
ncbi:MAG: hypothetical protein OXR73_27635, partial [Myxococcales bacterium]|nr:hypothetical protein [Myxococcales bacterium]